MKILFIHPNQPAQFEFIATALAEDPGNQVIMLSRKNLDVRLPGVKVIGFREAEAVENAGLPVARDFNHGISRAVAVARLCGRLKQDGFRPDLVVAHSGWGDGIYVKTVFPETPLINYMEFFNQPKGTDLDFFTRTAVKPNVLAKATTTNAIHLLNHHNADLCITPTYWQRSVHPGHLQEKIHVLHEGVDTRLCKPDRDAEFTLPSGQTLRREETEVITHVERMFDNYRGFPTFLKAMELIQQRRPNAHFLIVGKEGKGYSTCNFRALMKRAALAPERTHFLGHLNFRDYLKVLQVSSAHIYLTAPFVLSWSFLEAMAAGCPLVCSNTPPVAEIAEDGKTCLMVDFFRPAGIAEAVDVLLDDKPHAEALGAAAREKIVTEYDRRKLLPMFMKLVTDMAQGKGPDAAVRQIREWNRRWGREDASWQKSVPLFGGDRGQGHSARDRE